MSRWVHRLRLATVCTAFLALSLAQRPGLVVADTKLDLTVDPIGFLARALRLWEPEGFAGQVQNQAYGYLFPMGPFFALGHLLDIPSWVVQRLWWTLLLSVAFLGVVALARRLRIGSPTTVVLGGLAYALAPRMISGLGAISIEELPMAIAPWVLVPLVTGARTGSPRRAAALSGLAVACVGGVNAAATAAVLPLAALFLLTRRPGPRRRALLCWWSGSVLLATAWWLVPLLLLGRYSPPFLDYIETAAATTGHTELAQALRGTTQWIAYLSTSAGPIWPAGWALVHETAPILGSVALAAAGAYALTRRDLPERAWLVLGVLAGLTLVTAGHLGTVQGLAADPLHAALDGVLAPLRNVHKYDPVLRLPLSLGLAHVAAVAARRARRPLGVSARSARRLLRSAGLLVPVGIAVALAAAALPAVDGRLAAPTGWTDVPGYWAQTADWLGDASPAGRALLVPASSTGVYVWGSPGDEPLQPLAESPWEVRDAVPLTPPGHIRMLDAIEQRLAAGTGSAGLADYLARSGISYLVVRNDLDTGAAGSARPAAVHEAIADSPGLTRVAAFGPEVGQDTALLGRVLDAGLAYPARAVEVYAVAGAVPAAYTTPLADAVDVLGGPDGVLALQEQGLLGDQAALLPGGGDPAAGTDTLVSDALLRRERAFGRIDGAASGGLTAEDPLRLDGPARDYLLPAEDQQESVVRIDGGTVSASSSAADAGGLGGSQPAETPYAAVDGDPETTWRPESRLAAPAPVWWRVDSDAVLTADTVTVTTTGDPAGPAEVTVTTDAGALTEPLAVTDQPQQLRLPAGPTHSLTLSADPAAGATADPALVLAEVHVPGLSLRRTVVTPVPAGPVAAWSFATSGTSSAGCLPDQDGAVRCSPTLVTQPEEPRDLDRVFTAAQSDDYAAAVTVQPRPGAALDALLAAAAAPAGELQRLQAAASSAAVPDPRGSAWAAVDGDPGTTWLADPGDPTPTLTLSWDLPRTISSIHVVTAPGSSAVPLTVSVGTGGLAQVVPLAADGTARFAPLTTDHLVLRFPQTEPLSAFDTYTRTLAPLPVGISEVQVPGLQTVDPAAPVVVPCGSGPVLTVDGQAQAMSVTTTVADLMALRPVQAQPCGPAPVVHVGVGTHRLVVSATDAFRAATATLTRTGDQPAAAPRTPAASVTGGAEHRRVEVGARAAATLLVVPQNVNPGWTATLDGTRLVSRTVDGWQQAWVLPAGAAGVVHLDFAPATEYRIGLAAGAAALLLLLAVVLLPARRRFPAATGPRPAGVLVALAAVVGVALVGGALGLVLLAGLVVGWAAVRRRWPAAPGALVAAAAAGSGLGLLLVPEAELPRQVLGVVVVAGLAAGPVSAALSRFGVLPGTRSRQRASGSSTAQRTSAATTTPPSQVSMPSTVMLPASGLEPSSSSSPKSTIRWKRNRP